MAEYMSSQKMTRECDACLLKKEWELVNAAPEALAEMQAWFLLTRKVIIDGRPTQITGNACSLACVSAVAVKMALPPQEEPADDIDLASLRASNFQTN